MAYSQNVILVEIPHKRRAIKLSGYLDFCSDLKSIANNWSFYTKVIRVRSYPSTMSVSNLVMFDNSRIYGRFYMQIARDMNSAMHF